MRARVVVALAALIMLAPAPPPEEKVSVAPVAQGLGWLSGSWVQVRTGSTQEEHWSGTGQVMLGYARTLGPRDGVMFWEMMRIERGDDGRLTFFASPKGANWSAFPEAERGPGKISFANAAHDYPQRITYWREGDTLRARISMLDGSKPVEWRYRAKGR